MAAGQNHWARPNKRPNQPRKAARVWKTPGSTGTADLKIDGQEAVFLLPRCMRVHASAEHSWGHRGSPRACRRWWQCSAVSVSALGGGGEVGGAAGASMHGGDVEGVRDGVGDGGAVAPACQRHGHGVRGLCMHAKKRGGRKWRRKEGHATPTSSFSLSAPARSGGLSSLT